MKKIIPIIICLLMVNIVAALDEFDITLVAYNPKTKTAHIGVKNTGSQGYHDLTMIIDDSSPRYLGGLIKQGGAVKIPRGISPGKHIITISTAEGVTVSKEIIFPKSESQIRKEREVQEQIEEIKKEKGIIEEETKLRVYERKKTPVKNILIAVAIIIFFFIIYVILRRKRESKLL